MIVTFISFFSSRRRHTRWPRDWSSDVCSSDLFKQAGGKTDQAAPVASPQELAEYDAIIFGVPTRFGNMSAHMRNFLDQTGGLWRSEERRVGKECRLRGAEGPQQEYRRGQQHEGRVVRRRRLERL